MDIEEWHSGEILWTLRRDTRPSGQTPRRGMEERKSAGRGEEEEKNRRGGGGGGGGEDKEERSMRVSQRGEEKE